MRYKTITTIAAILSAINAVFFLLAPALSLSILGRTTNMTGMMNTRIAGAVALGLSMMTWLARDFTIPEVQRVVAIGNLTAFGILVFVDLHGVLTGAINGLGWPIFLADSFLAVGFLLFLISSPSHIK